MNGITWDKEPMSKNTRPGVLKQMHDYEELIAFEDQYGREEGYIADHLDPAKMSESDYIMGLLKHFRTMRKARELAERVNGDIEQEQTKHTEMA